MPLRASAAQVVAGLVLRPKVRESDWIAKVRDANVIPSIEPTLRFKPRAVCLARVQLVDEVIPKIEQWNTDKMSQLKHDFK